MLGKSNNRFARVGQDGRTVKECDKKRRGTLQMYQPLNQSLPTSPHPSCAGSLCARSDLSTISTSSCVVRVI